jgi:hypothetical protein
MKTLSFLLISLFVCLTTIGNPVYSNLLQPVNEKELPDLSKDKIFIKLTNEIFSLQHSNDEMNFAERNSSFNKIGIAVLALKNKYAALNDEVRASSMINVAIDKLVQQGTITKLNGNYSNNNFACLRELLKTVINCLKTSGTRAALEDCVSEAYAQYVVCSSND